MISFQNVSRTYNLDDKSIIMPVRGLSLKVKHGEFVLIIGRSGSGKTTLLNLASGLIKPTSGTVVIKGMNIWSLTDRQLSSLRARSIGFVFQFPSLIPSLNILENTVLASTSNLRLNKKSVFERASKLLSKLGLEGRMGVYPRQLSAGEQKRVVIARSMMNEPEILLADEPTSDLDERTEEESIAVFRELHSEGTTILMVTHNTDLAKYADRTLKMEEGNLVDIGLSG